MSFLQSQNFKADIGEEKRTYQDQMNKFLSDYLNTNQINKITSKLEVDSGSKNMFKMEISVEKDKRCKQLNIFTNLLS